MSTSGLFAIDGLVTCAATSEESAFTYTLRIIKLQGQKRVVPGEKEARAYCHGPLVRTLDD